jgi:hypothetical protein
MIRLFFSFFFIARFSPPLDRAYASMIEDTWHRAFDHLNTATCMTWFKAFSQCLFKTAKGGNLIGINAHYRFTIRVMKQL